MREPPRGGPPPPAAPRPGVAGSTTSACSGSVYVIELAGMTAMTFAIGGIAFFMPRYLLDRGHLDAKATPIFGGILVVAGLWPRSPAASPATTCAHGSPGSYFIVSAAGMLAGFP